MCPRVVSGGLWSCIIAESQQMLQRYFQHYKLSYVSAFSKMEKILFVFLKCYVT